MNDRLKQFLAAENITQAEFADTIKVARASVSHILAGRNKPGYEFISGILRHYPNLNIEWLISGKGRMYKTDDRYEESVKPGLFATEPVNDEPKDSPARIPPVILQEMQPEPPKRREAVKIVIFYDDGTFQEFQ